MRFPSASASTSRLNDETERPFVQFGQLLVLTADTNKAVHVTIGLVFIIHYYYS
jgi:hypothetical protein